MSKELEAFMRYCPIIPSENDFKCWSDYKIALQKYERYLQTFTKTYELLKKSLTELEELKRDVARFMELKNNITNREEMDEFWEIDNKLKKVGKEE